MTDQKPPIPSLDENHPIWGSAYRKAKRRVDLDRAHMERIEPMLKAAYEGQRLQDRTALLGEIVEMLEGMERLQGEGTYCGYCGEMIASPDCECNGYNTALDDIIQAIKDKFNDT